MKYLSLEKLYVEITRACDMQPECGHCVRGGAQDVTLSRTDIDGILSQIEMIGTLFITGGEPTLALDRIAYILYQAQARHIPVFQFRMVTNGLCDTEPVIKIIREWSSYIVICNSQYKEIDRPGSEFVELYVSKDRYHAHADISMRHFEEYQRALNGYANVTFAVGGNIPIFRGNATKNIEESDAWIPNAQSQRALRQITLLDSNHKPFCFRARSYKLIYPKQIIIPCDLYLTARGFVIPGYIGVERDYETCDLDDNAICRVSEPIYEKIFEFNRGKMDCFQYQAWESAHTDPAISAHNTNYLWRHMDDFRKLQSDGSAIDELELTLSEDEIERMSDPAFLQRYQREVLYRDYFASEVAEL